MLPEFEPIHLLYLAIAIVLEIAANVLMKQSHGFAYKRPAVAAIACALAAFTSESWANRTKIAVAAEKTRFGKREKCSPGRIGISGGAKFGSE